MHPKEPVDWAPGLAILGDVSPAAWIEAALRPSSEPWTVTSLVPPVFEAYARVLPPSYEDQDAEPRHRWPEIAAATGVPLTAETRFDDLVAGSDRWGRPCDGGLDARETAALARVLGASTGTPAEAYFCLWEGFGLEETEAWADRPMRVEIRTGRSTCSPVRSPPRRCCPPRCRGGARACGGRRTGPGWSPPRSTATSPTSVAAVPRSTPSWPTRTSTRWP